MQDKVECIFLEEKAIIEYLRKHGKGADTKDHELAIGVWIKRTFEHTHKKPHCIAFQLREGSLKSMQGNDYSDMGVIETILANLRKEDTPIDFVIVEGTAAKHADSGYGFQLKRFGKGIKTNFVPTLISYVNKTLKKNRPGEAGLIIIVDPDEDLAQGELDQLTGAGVSAEIIAKGIIAVPGSFKGVYLLAKSRNILDLIEVYPATALRASIDTHTFMN